MREYNNGNWSRARFNSFIKSALRSASVKWPPRLNAKKKARRERGKYLCAGYGRKEHVVPCTVNKKNNVFIDHVQPIGSCSTFDEMIDRMFCEEANLQLLCNQCHKAKTLDENRRSRD